MIISAKPIHCRGIAAYAFAAALMTGQSGCSPLLLPSNRHFEQFDLQSSEARPSPQPRAGGQSLREAIDPEVRLASDRRATDVPDLTRIDSHSSIEIEPVVSTRYETDIGQSIDEIVAIAHVHHPRVRAALRDIDIARAATVTASARDNPRLVIDVETPVYDSDDPTELTTRVTFPIGRAKEYRLRRRAAASAVTVAKANYRATLQEVGDAAFLSALKLAYLQRRFDLDVDAERISLRRAAALAPDQVDGDPADNLVRHVDAKLEADEAIARRYATERELNVARAALSAAMGLGGADPPTVAYDLDAYSVELPPLDVMLAQAEHDSAAIAVAMARLDQSHRHYDLQRAICVDQEIGPRYQDRLGEDDDTIGVRFETDVFLHDTLRGPVAESAAKARRQHAELNLAKHDLLNQVTQFYRELESLAAQITHYRGDNFIAEQRELLKDAKTQELMTAAQMWRVELAIVNRERELLQLQYRFALLRSSL